ncbi:MAG: prolyl aminopeptidase [Nanoarchaeota archaeon]
MYKKIRPYKNGYLKVSDGHKLYYELCGNKKGIPVIFLHGGPGAGISSDHRRYFNPKAYHIILFDQRGSGKSKPFASLKANTTKKLVQDTRAILKLLKIKKVFLFGGSWGSTLALVYAIKYPETVLGMCLRGIFLARPMDDRYFLTQSKFVNPEAYHRLMNLVPKRYKNNVLAYFHKQMLSKNKATRKKYTYEWSFYEISISKLKITQDQVKKSLKKFSYKSMSPIEVYYLKNNCFLPKNYILKNTSKIKNIPISIVHGKYDLICPPEAAYALHKKLRNSKLHFVLAGHSSSEPEIQQKLVSEMNRFAKVI